MKNKKPNIIYILNDHQVNYGHGSQGVRIKRPVFDKFASEGVRFERAYSVCPLCGPARRSMLTGLYPHNHGELINDADHPFDTEVYLDTLYEEGYDNYYFGKWHAGPETALEHHCEGFNYPSYNNPYNKPEYKEYLRRKKLPEPRILIEHNFSSFVPYEELEEGKEYQQDRSWCNEHASGIMLTPPETHEAFFLADMACEKLRELKEKEDGKPFHLRIDFWGPHQPYFPCKEYADMYSPSDIPEYPSFREDVYHNNKPEVYQSENNRGISSDDKIIFPNPLPWSVWQEVIARAYAQITMMDAAAGKILDAIKEHGFEENTIVIWTTDHGDALACHGGHFDKRSYMPEEMLRVPMAVRFPGKMPEGLVSNALVSNLDVAPTMLDAAGSAVKKDVDGNSLLKIREGNDVNFRDYFVCETHGHLEKHLGRAVITQRYKYIYNDSQIEELYDLCLDPYEMNNLYKDKAMSDILQKMRHLLKQWAQNTGDTVLLSSISGKTE